MHSCTYLCELTLITCYGFFQKEFFYIVTNNPEVCKSCSLHQNEKSLTK